MKAAMRAIILAGGKGTRLRPYTTTLPKPLVPVGDRAILDIVLRYALLFVVGCSELVAFSAHAFKPDMVARGIGWPTGNPFQQEVAVANLAFGVLGLLSFWIRGRRAA